MKSFVLTLIPISTIYATTSSADASDPKSLKVTDKIFDGFKVGADI